MSTPILGIYQDKPGWVRLSFLYNPAAIIALKAVAKGGYRYDPTIKTWFIREHLAQVVADAFSTLGYLVETDLVSNIPNAPANSNPWITILSQLNPTQVEELYRRAAMVLHPDKGGPVEVMAQLNTAYQERRKV